MSERRVRGIPEGEQKRAQSMRAESGVKLGDGLAPANPDQNLRLLPADKPPAPGDFRPRELRSDDL